MDDLVQWLRVQLDEDERVARAAGGRSEQAWEVDLSGEDPLGMPSWPVAVRYTTDGRLRGAVANLPVMQERSEDRMRHIAEHDPARVLREIDAKRQLLALHQERLEQGYGSDVCAECDFGGVSQTYYPCATLRLLALPYADRSGYREEWRP